MFLIHLKAFLESFSMPFSEFQNVYCIRRYSTKTSEIPPSLNSKYLEKLTI